MMRIRQGKATVTLTGDLQAWAERAVRAATRGAVDVLERDLDAVRVTAEAEWYGANGVNRVTGLSGDMAVVTTIDMGKNQVIVSIGSTDDRRQGAVPVPSFVHRAARNATRAKVVTAAEFWSTPKILRIGRARHDQPREHIKAGDWMIRVHSDRASDGKKLLPLFVNGPAKRAIKLAAPGIAAAMRQAIESTPNAR